MKSPHWMEDILHFIKGTFDFEEKSSTMMKKEAIDELDNFMILCFGDLLGFPMPTSYYTLEVLPYLSEELEGWEKRILRRESVVAERWNDFCC